MDEGRQERRTVAHTGWLLALTHESRWTGKSMVSWEGSETGLPHPPHDSCKLDLLSHCPPPSLSNVEMIFYFRVCGTSVSS